MEQHGIGKDAVVAQRGQFEVQEALLQRLEGAQVAPGPAAEIQQVKWRWPGYVLQQRRDVLAHVMVARALPVALADGDSR